MHSPGPQAAPDANSSHNENGHNGNGKVSRPKRNSRFTDNQGLKKTILFVDDEPAILEVRRVLFEALNYSVLTACSGEKALSLLQEWPVDAVVLDYLMPAMDGEEIARRIRKMHAPMAILLSSGCLDVPKSLLSIVDAFVDKGGGPLLLIKTLEQMLESQASPDRPAIGTSAGNIAG